MGRVSEHLPGAGWRRANQARTGDGKRARRGAAATAALVLGAGTAVAASAGPAGAVSSPPRSTCSNTTFPAGGGEFLVQRNEYASSAPECVTSDGGPDFTVTASGISNTGGAPGAFTSLYTGCHYGHCSASGLGHAPVREMYLIPGKVRISMTSSTPAPGYTGNVAFDTWMSTTGKAPAGKAKGTELMIWLGRRGGVQPAGSSHGTVTAAGRTWDLWLGKHRHDAGYTVTFLSPRNMTSLRGADLNQFAQYVTDHGWASQDWYLTAVDSGYEIWKGGTGLADRKVAVTIGDPGPPQGPKAPAAGKFAVNFGPGISRFRVCGETASRPHRACTRWYGGFSTSTSHVKTVSGTWRRGRVSVDWNRGGKGSWSACDTGARWSGSVRRGTVTLGTSMYPVGPGHSRC